MRSIGIDIGDFSVKIVELIHNKKNAYINQFQEKILSQNVSKEDKELEVIEFIRSFAATGDYSQARWVLALRQDQATTRFKSFPFSDRAKIQKVLGYEMEEDVPFDTENCVFESKIIQTQGPSADILASAVPKTQIENMAELIGNLGIEVHALTIEGLAFANLIENWENPPPNYTQNISLDEQVKQKKVIQIILNIGHKNTLFTAYENNRLIFTRSLYWGTSQIIQEIIKKNSLSYVEAVKILQTQSTIILSKENTSYDQAQTSGIITKAVRELARDIQMTLLELQSEFNAEVSALHFTGGASLIPNLGAYLTQNIEVACNPIQLLSNYTGALSVNSAQLQQIESRFSSAVAIALEGFKKPRNPALNLLKGEFAKQNKNLQFVWENWGPLISICGIGLVVFYSWTSFRDSFSTNLLEKGNDAIVLQAKNVARLPKKQANESGVKKFIKQNKKKITELKLVSQVAQMNSALDVLKKVSESSPGKSQIKLDIVQFTVKDDIVQIVGYANGPLEISSLTQSLKSLSTDGVVTNQPSRLTQVANKSAFNISFKTDRGVTK